MKGKFTIPWDKQSREGREKTEREREHRYEAEGTASSRKGREEGGVDKKNNNNRKNHTYLTADGAELGSAVAESDDLGGAHKGEIQGVEEQDKVAA